MRIPILLSLALAAACGGNQGSVTIKLTDAPGDFKAAVVTITEIDLVGSGGTAVLSNKTTTTNLLTLQNDVATLVEDATVQPGTYSELRFVISGGYIEVQNATGTGTTIYASAGYDHVPQGATVGGELKMPSFAQSGLKVTLPGGSVDVGAEAKVLLVDFDVHQSFGHDAGGSGSWVMHPVMNATDFSLSGNLNVTVHLDNNVSLPSGETLAQVNAVLTNSGGSAKSLALAPTAAGSATYGASFKYLIPGTYSLSLQADPSVTVSFTLTTTPAIPDTVTVQSGAATTADFAVSSAQ